jgi:hypothetical protein
MERPELDMTEEEEDELAEFAKERLAEGAGEMLDIDTLSGFDDI